MLRLVAALSLACAAVDSLLVTIRNDVSRLDTAGNIIDCHSGNIVAVNETFFWYGERYDNVSGIGPSPPLQRPHLVVYTSPDLQAWTYRGEIFSTWPNAPFGTFFTPWAVYDTATQTFVLWFNAYEHGCCLGNWGVATSADGLAFSVLSMNVSGKYGEVDCNAIMIDDDGTGYLLYTSEAQDHRHSIEVLSPNLTTTAGENLGLFGERYMEGGILWKRAGSYFASFGSCCCFCRNGSGVVVYSAPSIRGPWTRQPLDVNCARRDAGDVCGGYGDRSGDPITVNAQGIGLSLIPLADGSVAQLWHGERWLSAPDNDPTCPDECQPQTGKCQDLPGYVKGHGSAYWIPLAYGSDGSVQQFAPIVNEFTLDIAQGFGTAHLPQRGGGGGGGGGSAGAAPAE
jgi:hypothetical protein